MPTKMKYTNNNTPFYIVIALILIGWFVTWFNLQINNNDLSESYFNSKHELKSTIDKYNRQTTQLRYAEMAKEDLKDIAIDLKGKYELEKMRPVKMRSLSLENIVTKDSIKTKTDSAYTIDGSIVYHIKDSSKWHVFDIVAGKDSSLINYSIENEFVSWHQIDSKWYQSQKINVYSINLNPHTRSTEKIAYTVKEKRKYRLVWYVAIFTGGMLANNLILK